MLTLAAHRLEGETALEPIFQIYRKRWEIEALFGWIQEKTGIQTASKVRSERGLMVHVFGRLAAAMFLLAFNL
jgi:transposase